MGRVLNDAGQGVAGVTIVLHSRGRKWSAATEADGSFFVSSLVAGEYDVQGDEDSLPPGYSADALADPQHVIVGAASPGQAAFKVRAFRSISGRVLRYDPAAGRYVPVNRAQVMLREPALTTLTDPSGRYLFRDLPAGSYTLAVHNQARTPAKTVRLSAQPVDLVNVDFQIGGTVPKKDVPAPATPPVKPQPQAANVLDPKPATAQRHNLLGRELTQAGRFREAIDELTEAVRIDPDFALAYNARGFALVMLHDWARAIEDLDKAILLNPRYANAYQIRAIAKRSIGDAPGAAADSERSQQLIHSK
jgi:tetratricopeptide (TPR) repeat protein